MVCYRRVTSDTTEGLIIIMIITQYNLRISNFSVHEIKERGVQESASVWHVYSTSPLPPASKQAQNPLGGPVI